MKPKFFGIWKHRKEELTSEQIKNDIVAGIIVAIIALPLSVALAISSGVTPDKGLVTAIVAGFLISLLGGSRVQIGGPTGAFVVIVYGIIATYGLDGLIIATIMAGAMMILMGLLHLGSVIKYIPYPTTTGFTSGIAVVLLSTQVKDFFGLTMDHVPSEFLEKWKAYFEAFHTIDITTCLVGLISLLIIVFWPKVNKTIPGSLVALVLATLAVQLLHLPVETIGSRFGTISGRISLIDFGAMNLSLDTIKSLVRPALTIAFLAGIESLLSAVVADGMIGKKHDSNMELMGQGIANIASALLGGIPATGAIARTAANVKNGGRTPLAGMVHAVTLFLIMVLFMPLAGMIPMATLAAILVVVAYNMSEWRAFKGIFSTTKSDVITLVATFVLTVLFDLVIAIEVGMVIAMFLFVKRMTESKVFEELKCENHIAVYEISGPLFYGVVSTFLDMLSDVKGEVKILVLQMKYVNCMDATALNALRRLDARCKAQKILILYVEAKEQPRKLLEKSGFAENTGIDRFFERVEDAVRAGEEILEIADRRHGNAS